MHKFWHALSSVAVAAIAYSTPVLQTAIAAHPAHAIGAMAGWAILGNLLPAPADWLTRKAKG